MQRRRDGFFPRGVSRYREESLKEKEKKRKEREKRQHVQREESPGWNSDETGSDTAFLPTLKLFLYRLRGSPCLAAKL